RIHASSTSVIGSSRHVVHFVLGPRNLPERLRSLKGDPRFPHPPTLPYPESLDYRSEGVMAESTVKGSCLCGAVKYEVTGEPKRFYHCHCSRCRKVTGTGHASNM